jgi:hypothetical protein
MYYAIEMGPGTLIYISSFIKIGLGIQRLLGGYTHKQTPRLQGDSISLLLFFQNKESGLKITKHRKRLDLRCSVPDRVTGILFSFVSGKLSVIAHSSPNYKELKDG